MSQHDDPELTPAQEARIRAALAAARVTEPMPDAVAGRLDAALADLVRERDTSAPVADPERPVSLAARRNRRGRWILAAGVASAAAVVVLSVPGLRPLSTGSSDQSGSAADKHAATAGQPPEASGTSSLSSAVPPQLHTATFGADVRRLLAGRPERVTAGSDAKSAQPSPPPAAGVAACDQARPRAGVVRQQPVLVDGTPALLEELAAHGETRVVRAVSCAGGRTLATTRVPVR